MENLKNNTPIMLEAFVGDKLTFAVSSWAATNPAILAAFKRISNKKGASLVAFLTRTIWNSVEGSTYLKLLDGLGSVVIASLMLTGAEKGLALKDAGIETVRQGTLVGLSMLFPASNWLVPVVGYTFVALKLMNNPHYRAALEFLGMSPFSPSKELITIKSVSKDIKSYFKASKDEKLSLSKVKNLSKKIFSRVTRKHPEYWDDFVGPIPEGLTIRNPILAEAYLGDKVSFAVNSWAAKNPSLYFAMKRAFNKRKASDVVRFLWWLLQGKVYVKMLDGLGSSIISALYLTMPDRGEQLKKAGIETVRQGTLIAFALLFPGIGSWMIPVIGYTLQKLGLMTKVRYDAIVKFLEFEATPPKKEVAKIIYMNRSEHGKEIVMLPDTKVPKGRMETIYNKIYKGTVGQNPPEEELTKPSGRGNVIQGAFGSSL